MPLIPLLITAGMLAKQALTPKRQAAPTMPQVPGPTDAEVLAADLRLRRSLARQGGRGSTVVSGGLGGSEARLTMPTLIGM